MHTFYVDNRAIGADEAKHAFRVLRLKKGDQVTCLSDGRRYLARIVEISDKGGSVELLEELPSNESPLRITLYQGLPKAEKLEFLAQKLTELGVSRLVPVRMERSIAKADGDKRLDRLARIAHEAVKQCRRARPMEITSPMTWKDALSDMEKRELMIVPWENASAVRMADVREENPGARDIGILIGPEGGISQTEIDAAPARPVLLGPRILRAETAAVTAAVLAMAMWGDI
jgi:16S rRNA (uracil1498-N3)-methyltransferase